MSTHYNLYPKPVRHLYGLHLHCANPGTPIHRLTLFPLCFHQRAPLCQRLQTFLQKPASAPAAAIDAGDNGAELSAADILSGTAVPAQASDAPSTSRIPRPTAEWKSKRNAASGGSAAAAPCCGSAAADGAAMGSGAASQHLDAYSSEFAWMLSLPTQASASQAAAQGPARGAAAPAQGGSRASAPAAVAADGDGELVCFH